MKRRPTLATESVRGAELVDGARLAGGDESVREAEPGQSKTLKQRLSRVGRKLTRRPRLDDVVW
jgi:hypothetical protein